MQKKLDSRLIESIKKGHPLQYGFDPDGKIVFDPGENPDITERYNRCPVCEQWSPCDVRELLKIVLYDIEHNYKTVESESKTL